ncbi:MAG: hypothetical protein ABR509_08535 [Candidatus Limnocylindria bacterium]
MSGFFGDDLAGTLGTWLAAAITLSVWAYLVGERRAFAYAQHLLAGLLTGYVVVISIREVLVPFFLDPLVRDPRGHAALWPAILLAGVVVVGRFLPRPLTAIPVSILVGGTAAFALAGAVVGTLTPQLAKAILPGGGSLPALVGGAVSVVIMALVVVSFRHGVAVDGFAGRASVAGRWLLMAGLGGWFGFMLLGRLVLVIERIGFLLFEWLKIGR